MARNEHGATSVLDRTNDSHDGIGGPTTRDIPLPPRSIRLGLTTTPPSTTPGSTIQRSTVQPSITPARSDVSVLQALGITATESTPADDTPVIDEPGSPQRTARGEGPSNSLKARTALVAMAAGAVAVAVAGSGNTGDVSTPVPLAAADGAAAGVPANAAPAATTPSAATTGTEGGIVPAASTADMDGYSSQLAVGKRLAAAAAAREAAARKPLFAAPITDKYSFTSGYAMRWGSFHGGLDLAAPLGTPIHAVTDGVVKEAGPASGYGNWIQVQAEDGTITMYGHMASSGVLVTKGQKVTAGDVIGLVGSEGFSTGPHLHFEVWKSGSTKIDPAPWLAAKGIRLNAYTG